MKRRTFKVEPGDHLVWNGLPCELAHGEIVEVVAITGVARLTMRVQPVNSKPLSNEDSAGWYAGAPFVKVGGNGL